MGIYNFQPRFVPFIESGQKTHTIRAPRRNRDSRGSVMHLYVGLRRKGARLIRRVRCTAVENIVISKTGQVYVSQISWAPEWAIRKPTECGFVKLSSDERDALAKRDGFSCFSEMIEFWKGRLPFIGNIYHWEYPREVE